MRNMRRANFAIIITLLLGACHAQTNFWDTPNAYLGQTPPGNVPVRFYPTLLDTPFFMFDRCAFSPDGKDFYFCSNNTWFSNKDATIKNMHFDGSKWVGPTLVTPMYYAPSFSQTGDTIFVIGGGKGGVSFMRRTDTGFTKPGTYLKRSYGLYDFMPTNSGNMYAASNFNGPINDYSFYDVAVMPPLGADTTIRSLGKPMNTPGFDGDFYVAPDESYILISAKEQPDFECEIFISYHKTDGTWTNPKSLGPEINNGKAHRWGEYVTPDKKYLFYSYGHSPADCGLYWVRFDTLLEKLRHTNFEPYVKDSIPAQSVKAGQDFSLKINDNTFFDDDGRNMLKYSAASIDGGTLPKGLVFDAEKRMFTGKLAKAGDYKITVTATDNGSVAAASTFILTVK